MRMNLQSSLRFSLILLLAICAHGVALAEEFTIVTNMLPPIKFVHDGKLQGAAPDILNELLRGTDFSIGKDIEIAPLEEAMRIVKETPGTILPALVKTPQREADFKWVGPIYTSRFGLIAKRSSHIRLRTLNNARPYRIATIINSTPETILLKLGFNEDFMVRNPQATEAVKALDEDRAQLLCFAISPTFHVMMMNGIDPTQYQLVHEIRNTELYIAFNKETDDTVIQALQSALDTLREPKSDGKSRYQDIVDKYFIPFI